MQASADPARSVYAQVLGVSDEERQRLLAQAQELEPEARWLLDRLGVQPGWRAIDLGCGPIGILDLLSERVGPEGEVMGMDLESRFVDMARQIITERQLSNVRLLEGDATDTGLPRASFELVHERLLLIGPARTQILSEMVALARPGGIVAIQEIDLPTSYCEPAHPAWDTLLEAFQAAVYRSAADLSIGRRLPALLRQAGLIEVQAEAHARLARPGESRRMQLLSLLEPVRRAGVFSNAELNEHMAALRGHLEDPNTLVLPGVWFQAWGRKPSR